MMTSLRDGLVTIAAALLGASMLGARGVIDGNAFAALLIGLRSCSIGWLFIKKLTSDET